LAAAAAAAAAAGRGWGRRLLLLILAETVVCLLVLVEEVNARQGCFSLGIGRSEHLEKMREETKVMVDGSDIS
jgi:hypothetical protein